MGGTLEKTIPKVLGRVCHGWIWRSSEDDSDLANNIKTENIPQTRAKHSFTRDRRRYKCWTHILKPANIFYLQVSERMGFHPGLGKEEKAKPNCFLWWKCVASRNSNRSRPCDSRIRIHNSGDFWSSKASGKGVFSKGASLLSGSCSSYGRKPIHRQHWGYWDSQENKSTFSISSFIQSHMIWNRSKRCCIFPHSSFWHPRMPEGSRISPIRKDSSSLPLWTVTWKTISCSMPHMPTSYFSLQVVDFTLAWHLMTQPFQFDVTICKMACIKIQPPGIQNTLSYRTSPSRLDLPWTWETRSIMWVLFQPRLSSALESSESSKATSPIDCHW